MGHSWCVCWLLTKKEQNKIAHELMQTIIARRSERGGLANAAAAADRADGGGQYCQVPRHVRRQGRGGAARGHAAAAGRRSLLRSRRASACLRPRVCSACLLCVAVWEERSNHIRSCVRCELLAVRAQEPWRVCRLGDVTYTRFAQLGLRLRGSVRFEVRGRRVCLWLRPLYCLSLCVFYVCLLTY